MKSVFAFTRIFITFLMVSCGHTHTHKSSIVKVESEKEMRLKREQDSLAFELCQIYGLDQGIRLSEGFENKMRLIQSVDTFCFEKIVTFTEKHGFPNKKLLGNSYKKHECVNSVAGAVLLHNPHRLVNEKRFFNLFLNEVEKGNMSRELLALVLDKYYWVRKDESGNRKVIYGTQFGMPCRKYKEQSDRARKEIGLPPLADSLFVNCPD